MIVVGYFMTGGRPWYKWFCGVIIKITSNILKMGIKHVTLIKLRFFFACVFARGYRKALLMRTPPISDDRVTRSSGSSVWPDERWTRSYEVEGETNRQSYCVQVIQLSDTAQSSLNEKFRNLT